MHFLHIYRAVIKKKLLDANIENSFVIVPRNNIVFYDYNLYKGVTDTVKRSYFLLTFFFFAHGKHRLNIILFTTFVSHKINFQLSTLALLFFILITV